MKTLLLFMFNIIFLVLEVNSQNQELVFPIKHSATLTSLKYSPSRQYIATTSNDFTIKLWKTNSISLIRTFTGHKASVLFIDFSKNEKYIVSSGNDSTIIIWDINSGKIMIGPIKMNDKITSLCFNPDNKGVYIGTNNGKILGINCSSGKTEKELTFESLKITHLSFVKNNNNLLVSLSKQSDEQEMNSKGSFILVDLNYPNKPFVISNYNEDVSQFCFNNDSSKILTSADNGMVRVWNAKSYIEEISFKNNNLTPGFLFISANGKMIGVIGQKDNAINVWRISGERLFDFAVDQGKAIFGEFNEDYTRIHICNDLGKYMDFDLNARERDKIGNFLLTESYVTSIALSSTSAKIAIGYKNGVIRAFDLVNSKPIFIISPKNTQVLSMSFSNDDKKLIVSSDQSIIYDENSPYPTTGESNISIIETNTGTRSNNIVLKNDYSTVLCTSGNYILAGLNNGIIKIYDINKGNELNSIQAHDYDIIDMSLSGDGKTIVTGSMDATIKAFKIENIKLTQINSLPFKNEIRNVKYFSSDKTLIASEKKSGIVIIPKSTPQNSIPLKFSYEVQDMDASEKDSLIFISLNSGQAECIALSALNGKEQWRFIKNGPKIIGITYSILYNIAFCVLENGNILLLNPKNGKEMGTLVLFNETDWLIFSPENYFDASPNITKSINIVENMNFADSTEVEKYHKTGLLNNLLQENK